MKNTNLVFTTEGLRIEVTGANLLQALGHLEAELCAHTGAQDALSEHPSLPEAIQALQDGNEFDLHEMDPEENFTLRASVVEGPHGRDSADVESKPAPPRRCDRDGCDKEALWVGWPNGGSAIMLCPDHADEAHLNGWKLSAIFKMP